MVRKHFSYPKRPLAGQPLVRLTKNENVTNSLLAAVQVIISNLIHEEVALGVGLTLITFAGPGLKVILLHWLPVYLKNILYILY